MKVLDSSLCADYLRGREPAREYRLDHLDESLVAPSVIAYELYHGAVREGRDPVLVDDDLPWVDHLAYDRSHALESARIRQELEAEGRCIQHPDMMVAGTARKLGVPLVSADGDFEMVRGLHVENHRDMY